MGKARFIPFGENVLVQRYDDGKGQLVVPESVKEKEKPSLGRVLEVGPILETEESIAEYGEVRPGDIVAFPSYGPHEIRIAGATLLIVDRKDLLGKLVTVEDNEPRAN
jgi:co-chaperonin GroES (HSP10)